MTFADELMEYASDIWDQYMTHPFIQGIIRGTLDKEKFKDYLIQDCLYLKDYAKVYAHAFVKCDNVELMRDIYRDMGVIVCDESMTHIRYLKDMGYSEMDAYSTPVNKENREYLDFMLDTAQNGTVADGLISVMACAFSYYVIAVKAKAAAEKLGTVENNYFAGWFIDYSGAGYKTVYDSSYALTNRVAESMTEIDKQRAKEIFLRASEYELGFWNMAMREKN